MTRIPTTMIKKMMMTLLVAGSALAAVFFTGCAGPLAASAGATAKTGTLSISIGSTASRTLLPNVDMTVASYDISGAGPSGASFTRSTTGASTQITGLAAGSWSITVLAKNQDAQVIGRGVNSTTVSGGSSASVAVTVVPLQGNGTLSLTVSFPAADVVSPSIEASLLPQSGSSLPLSFTAGSGTATCTDGAIPGGYYTLTLRLLDAGIPVMGAVEVVRIAQDATTSGTFAFTSVNKVTASISVNITADMADPLAVTLSGAAAELAQGTDMTVSAGVTDYTDNVTYVFYLNGVAKASGSTASPTWTFGSDLAVGTYRIDVTAYSADGLRAGSASANFTVAVSGSVTLEWNANTETGVTGYKVYYGTESGTYPSVVDVGNVTTATVSGLIVGQTYYFAVTAYSSTTESARSTEVSYTVQ